MPKMQTVGGKVPRALATRVRRVIKARKTNQSEWLRAHLERIVVVEEAELGLQSRAPRQRPQPEAYPPLGMASDDVPGSF